MVAERLVALADGFAEAVLPRLRDERVALRGVAGDAVEDVEIIALLATPWLYSALFIASLTMMSWLIGTAAIRSTRRSVRSSRSFGSGASTARPHSAACAPVMQSPVSRRRLARWSPSRCAHIPAAGTPHTRVGG